MNLFSGSTLVYVVLHIYFNINNEISYHRSGWLHIDLCYYKCIELDQVI